MNVKFLTKNNFFQNVGAYQNGTNIRCKFYIFSDKFTRLYGWSKSEIIGRSAILDFMFGQDTEVLFIQSMKDSLEKCCRFSSITNLYDKYGDKYQFQISVSPITNNYENRIEVAYYFISVINISQNEKKRAVQKRGGVHSKMNKFLINKKGCDNDRENVSNGAYG